jgi:hypothetical protein
MWGLIFRYGIIAGLIVAVPMLWRMLTADAEGGDPLGGIIVGYLTMLVALTAVFLGVKQYRDKVKGGVIRFLPAFGVGLGISAVACLLYVIAWEISLASSDMDFIAWYSNQMIEGAKAKGASPDEIAKATADAKSFAEFYAQPLLRIPMTFLEMFPVGLLVSLISAAVLRNSRILPARASA